MRRGPVGCAGVRRALCVGEQWKRRSVRGDAGHRARQGAVAARAAPQKTSCGRNAAECAICEEVVAEMQPNVLRERSIGTSWSWAGGGRATKPAGRETLACQQQPARQSRASTLGRISDTTSSENAHSAGFLADGRQSRRPHAAPHAQTTVWPSRSGGDPTPRGRRDARAWQG